MQALNASIRALPADWDVLHLHLCLSTPKAFVGPGIRIYSRGFCTLGLLYTRRAALKVLHEAEMGSRNVDNIIMDLVAVSFLLLYFSCSSSVDEGVVCVQSIVTFVLDVFTVK